MIDMTLTNVNIENKVYNMFNLISLGYRSQFDELCALLLLISNWNGFNSKKKIITEKEYYMAQLCCKVSLIQLFFSRNSTKFV